MRLTLLAILGLVGGFAALAAPAPPGAWPKPDWKELDPEGGCKFVRKGEALIIEVPGKRHHEAEYVSPPMLRREVAGDFMVQARVGSSGFLTEPGLGKKRFACAGIVLRFGANTHAILEKSWAKREDEEQDVNSVEWLVGERVELTNSVGFNYLASDTTRRGPGRMLRKDEVYFRLERKGNILLPAYSEDGITWQQMKPFTGPLPKTLKLGVFATNPGGQSFKPRFDRFRLTVKKD